MRALVTAWVSLVGALFTLEESSYGPERPSCNIVSSCRLELWSDDAYFESFWPSYGLEDPSLRLVGPSEVYLWPGLA